MSNQYTEPQLSIVFEMARCIDAHINKLESSYYSVAVPGELTPQEESDMTRMVDAYRCGYTTAAAICANLLDRVARGISSFNATFAMGGAYNRLLSEFAQEAKASAGKPYKMGDLHLSQTTTDNS